METTEITVNWESIHRYYLSMLEGKTNLKRKEIARAELLRMAKAADSFNTLMRERKGAQPPEKDFINTPAPQKIISFRKMLREDLVKGVDLDSNLYYLSTPGGFLLIHKMRLVNSSELNFYPYLEFTFEGEDWEESYKKILLDSMDKEGLAKSTWTARGFEYVFSVWVVERK